MFEDEITRNSEARLGKALLFALGQISTVLLHVTVVFVPLYALTARTASRHEHVIEELINTALEPPGAVCRAQDRKSAQFERLRAALERCVAWLRLQHGLDMFSDPRRVLLGSGGLPDDDRLRALCSWVGRDRSERMYELYKEVLAESGVVDPTATPGMTFRRSPATTTGASPPALRDLTLADQAALVAGRAPLAAILDCHRSVLGGLIADLFAGIHDSVRRDQLALLRMLCERALAARDDRLLSPEARALIERMIDRSRAPEERRQAGSLLYQQVVTDLERSLEREELHLSVFSELKGALR